MLERILKTLLTWKDFEYCYSGRTENSKYKTGINEIDKIYTGIE